MRTTLLMVVGLILSLNLFSQEERKFIRQGVRSWEKDDFNQAEVDFKKAEEEAPGSMIAKYNTGTALYGQGKYKESYEQFSKLAEEAESNDQAADIWYNAGNSLVEQSQYAESVEAYKNSLRLRPDDPQTRYNLAYALEKLKQQQQQQQQQQQDGKDGQDDKNKLDQNQDQKQNQDKNKQDQDQQNQQQDKQDKQQQEQQSAGQYLPKDEAERLLNALESQEKEVKAKVDKEKAKAAKVKTVKDW